MAFYHVAPPAGLVKGVAQILEKSDHGLVTEFERGEDGIEIAGKARIMAPQFLSLIAHVMLYFMPAFKKHGLDLYLEGIVDAHVPGLR